MTYKNPQRYKNGDYLFFNGHILYLYIIQMEEIIFKEKVFYYRLSINDYYGVNSSNAYECSGS